MQLNVTNPNGKHIVGLVGVAFLFIWPFVIGCGSQVSEYPRLATDDPSIVLLPPTSNGLGGQHENGCAYDAASISLAGIEQLVIPTPQEFLEIDLRENHTSPKLDLMVATDWLDESHSATVSSVRTVRHQIRVYTARVETRLFVTVDPGRAEEGKVLRVTATYYVPPGVQVESNQEIADRKKTKNLVWEQLSLNPSPVRLVR